MSNTGKKNLWWLSVIIGVIFIMIGVSSLFTPLQTLVTVTYFIGFLFLFTGIGEFFSVAQSDSNWGWTVVSAAIDFIIGILFLTMPAEQAMLTAVFLFGFWVLFRSILGLGIVLNLKKTVSDPSKLNGIMVMPIIGIILGFVFLAMPVVGAGALVFIFGLAIISFGIFEIYWGMALKRS